MTAIWKNCYSPGYLHHCLGDKNRFWGQLWTLTEHISATEHYINNRKNSSIYRNSPEFELWPRNVCERLASFCPPP